MNESRLSFAVTAKSARITTKSWGFLRFLQDSDHDLLIFDQK